MHGNFLAFHGLFAVAFLQIFNNQIAHVLSFHSVFNQLTISTLRYSALKGIIAAVSDKVKGRLKTGGYVSDDLSTYRQPLRNQFEPFCNERA